MIVSLETHRITITTTKEDMQEHGTALMARLSGARTRRPSHAAAAAGAICA